MLSALVAIIIGIMPALIITRGITKPVKKSVDFAKLIADGDLTASLDIHQKDEIGVLANALDVMSNNLKNMTIQIQEGSEQIASSSEELSATAQQLQGLVARFKVDRNAVVADEVKAFPDHEEARVEEEIEEEEKEVTDITLKEDAA